MAIRTKTIQYWLGQETSSIASGSVYVHPYSTMLYIAETGSRTIRNVFAEVFWRDVASALTNRGNVATQSLFLQLGNNPYTTASIVTQLTDTGEHVNYVGGFDLTEYFSSSFGSNNTSQSCNWQYHYLINQPLTQSYQIRGLATSLYITYNYDDTNTSIRSKTATIPLGYTASLAASTWRELDIIPALDTYCTESNKTFDQIWLEMEGSNGHTSATNYSMSFFLDNDPKTGSFEVLNPTNCGSWIKYYFPLSHIDTSTIHRFKANVSTTGVIQHTANALTIKATYRYNHDNSNYILNTPEFIFDNNIDAIAYIADNDLVPTNGYFNIQEPLPIIQKNCAMKIYSSLTSATTIRIYAKEGPSITWIMPANSVEVSGQLGQFRIDQEKSSPFTGSAALLNRGDNYFAFSYSTTDAQRLGSMVTTIILNYISGKDPRGDGVHTHTVTSLATTGSTNSSLTPHDTVNFLYGKSILLNSPISDSDYYINSNFIESYLAYAAGSTAGAISGTTAVVTSLDNIGGDSIYISGSTTDKIVLLRSDVEIGTQRIVSSFDKYFTKYPHAIEKRNPLQTNITRYFRNTSIKNHSRFVTTYHAISYTITGSINGYSGNGSGIIVDCIESGSNPSNEGKIFRAITATNGVFSGSVYDNTKQYYVTARQSSILTSRSDDATGSIIV